MSEAIKIPFFGLWNCLYLFSLNWIVWCISHALRCLKFFIQWIHFFLARYTLIRFLSLIHSCSFSSICSFHEWRKLLCFDRFMMCFCVFSFNIFRVIILKMFSNIVYVLLLSWKKGVAIESAIFPNKTCSCWWHSIRSDIEAETKPSLIDTTKWMFWIYGFIHKPLFNLVIVYVFDKAILKNWPVSLSFTFFVSLSFFSRAHFSHKFCFLDQNGFRSRAYFSINLLKWSV